MNKLKKYNVISARMFYQTMRFIDDLTTISGKNLEENIQNIYPAEVKLTKKKKQINKISNFLDLNINIQNSGLRAKL